MGCDGSGQAEWGMPGARSQVEQHEVPFGAVLGVVSHQQRGEKHRDTAENGQGL